MTYRPELNVPDGRIKGYNDLPKPQFPSYDEFVKRWTEPYHPQVLNAKLIEYGWQRYWKGFWTGILLSFVVTSLLLIILG